MAVTIHIGLYTYAFVKYSGVNRLAEEEKSSDYELIKEGDESILKIDYEINLNIPSIEDDSTCMARTIERLKLI